MNTKIRFFLFLCIQTLGVSAAEPILETPFPSQKHELKNGEIIHTRTLAGDGAPLKILLLSGPTDHWHADSAWFARLQPMLASKSWENIAIDRPGTATRNSEPNPPNLPRGFGSLAPYLDEIIAKAFLTKSPLELIVVAYASSNLSIWPWLKTTKYKDNIRGIILIDPDVLLPHSISQYKSDAETYRKNYEKYLEYVHQGKYQERTNAIAESERQHFLTLLPEFSSMDWNYYNSVEKWRASLAGQLHKIDEVASYARDLDTAYSAGDTIDIPFFIIDTDFEKNHINAFPEKTGLVQWQQEGTLWFKGLADKSNGQYYELIDSDHLVMVQKPELIIDIINQILFKKH